MTKTLSTVIICIVCVIALFFGVVSCLPGGLEYGNYNEYNAPINLIQGSSLFNDSIVATYKVKLDEDANINDVVKNIRSRLSDMYGYYFSNVKVNGDDITVQVPKTANGENTSAATILSNVTAVGKVEILTESTYSADKVILTAEHVKSMTLRNYSSGANAYYIVNMNLTKEGKEIAAENLTPTSYGYSAYLAVDGTVSYAIVYDTNQVLQVYTTSKADARWIKGLTQNGALTATLTSVGTEEVSSNGGLIFALVMAVIVVACWIFLIARYKSAGFATVVSQLVAVVAFIMFSGMVYFAFLNIASAVGIVLGYALMMVFTVLVLEKLRTYSAEKTFASAKYRAFQENNKWNLIVHAIVAVLGSILWLIPTGVTAPLGNALVYCAVISFVATMGLNRLFAAVLAPFCEGATKTK